MAFDGSEMEYGEVPAGGMERRAPTVGRAVSVPMSNAPEDPFSMTRTAPGLGGRLDLRLRQREPAGVGEEELRETR